MTRIVVADHHVIVREGLTRLLNERAGFEVVGQAGDGEVFGVVVPQLRRAPAGLRRGAENEQQTGTPVR